MKRKISKVLIASICLNAIMLLMLCGVAYYKREGIKRRIEKLFSHEVVSEKNLKQFNKEPYEFSNGCIETGNEERINITACLDNLGKGASGAAMECMNIML